MPNDEWVPVVRDAANALSEKAPSVNAFGIQLSRFAPANFVRPCLSLGVFRPNFDVLFELGLAYETEARLVGAHIGLEVGWSVEWFRVGVGIDVDLLSAGNLVPVQSASLLVGARW